VGNLKNCGTENSGTVGRNFGGCEGAEAVRGCARRARLAPTARAGRGQPSGGGGRRGVYRAVWWGRNNSLALAT